MTPRATPSPQPGRVHKWALGAFATLVDDAVTHSDVHIDVLRSPDGEPFLILRHNGPGLSREQIAARTAVQPPVQAWQASTSYRCPWQAAVFRLGADVTVLTKNANSSFAALLSRNRIADMYDPANESPNVIVEWRSDLSQQDRRVAAFCTYSPWHTVHQISDIFASIHATGTVLAISSLNRDIQQAQLELDLETDPLDIRLTPPSCTTRNHFVSSIRLSHSLRSYLEMLYINPSFRIYLRGQLIRERRLFTTMYARRDYIYNYHRSLHPPSTSRPHPSKTVAFRFGFDPDAHENEYGMLLYHNRRLVKPFLKLGIQVHTDSQVRVVGIIDTAHLNPTPNMQSFEQDSAYQDLIFTLGQALNKYWTPYGSMTNVYRKHCNDPLPKWLRCDACARWRQLAPGVPYPPSSARVQWNCSMNQGATNECNAPDDVDHRPVPVERLLPGANFPTPPTSLPRKRPRSPKASTDCEAKPPNPAHAADGRIATVESPDMVPSEQIVSPLPRLQTPADVHSLTPEMVHSDGAAPRTDPFSLRESTSPPLSRSTSSLCDMLEMAANAAPLSGAVYQASSKVEHTSAQVLSNDGIRSYDLKPNIVHGRPGPTNITTNNHAAERAPVQSAPSYRDPLSSQFPPTPSQAQHRNRDVPSNTNITTSLDGEKAQSVPRETPRLTGVQSDIQNVIQPQSASNEHAFERKGGSRSNPSQLTAGTNNVRRYLHSPRNLQLYDDRTRQPQRNSHSDNHQSQTRGSPPDTSRPALQPIAQNHARDAHVPSPNQQVGRKQVHQQHDSSFVTIHKRRKKSSSHSTHKYRESAELSQSLHNGERAGEQSGRIIGSKDMISKPDSKNASYDAAESGVGVHQNTSRLSKEGSCKENRELPDPLGDKSKPVTPARNLLQTPVRTRQDDQGEHCLPSNLPSIPGMPSPNTANSFLDMNTENLLVAAPLNGIDMSRDFLNFGDIELGLKTPSQLKPVPKKRTPSIARAETRNQSTPQGSGRFESTSLVNANVPGMVSHTEQRNRSDKKEQPKSQPKGLQKRGTRSGTETFRSNLYGKKRGSTDRTTLKHMEEDKLRSEFKSNRQNSRMEPTCRQRRVEDSTHGRVEPADRRTLSDLSAAIPWSQIAATAAAAGAFAAAAATAGNANGSRSQARMEYQLPLDSTTVKASKERIDELREELREQKNQTELYKGKLQELICCLAPAVNGGVTTVMKKLEELSMSELSKDIMKTVSGKAKEDASRDQLQTLQASRASEEIACASLEKLRRLVRTFLDEAVGMVRLDEHDKPIEKHLEDYLHLIDILPTS